MGHEVTVITPSKHKKGHTYRNSGLTDERILTSWPGLKGESLLRRTLSQAIIALGMVQRLVKSRAELKNVDLIIGTVPPLPTSAVTAIAGRWLKKPYCIDLRDAWPDLLQNFSEWDRALGQKRPRQALLESIVLGPIGRVTEFAINKSITQSRAIIVTSQDLACELEQRFRDAHGDKPEVFIVRNVFPSAVEPGDLTRPVKRKGELHVLYAGNLGRAQNLRNAIRAASVAMNHGLKVTLRFVGAGAARDSLEKYAEEMEVPVEVCPQRPPSSMAEVYNSCHTALVHLTDWEPLERAVPSKTYELLSLGIHISGVVGGETARLIKELNAGHVVEPESPEALAEMWLELDRNPSLLETSKAGKAWVENERTCIAPNTMAQVLNHMQRNVVEN